MKSWRIITVLLLSLVLASATACNPLGGGDEKVTEGLVEVVRGDLIVTVSGSGNIEVSNEMELTFGVAGKVDEIHVQEGDEVSEGDVLAQLDTSSLEQALAQAKLALAQAKLA